MACIFNLIRRKTQEETKYGIGLYDLARKQGIDITNKADIICKLSDQPLSKRQEELVKMKKSELVSLAEEKDFSSSGAKADVLERALLHSGLERQESASEPAEDADSSAPTIPEKAGSKEPLLSGIDEDERLPREGLVSHFDTVEERVNAIKQSAVRATQKAVDKGRSYVVIESFRPKDHSEPLMIQASYVQRHPDSAVVFEAQFPNTPYFIHTAKRNAIRL